MSNRRIWIVAAALLLVIAGGLWSLQADMNPAAIVDLEPESQPGDVDLADGGNVLLTSVNKPRSQSHSSNRASQARSQQSRQVQVPGASRGIPLPEMDPYVGEDLQGRTVEYVPSTIFPTAAAEFDVPVSLLKAVAYVESHGEHGSGLPRANGGRGVMGLKEMRGISQVTAAAALLKVTPAEVVLDPVVNIRGGAALLRHYYDLARGDGKSDAWQRALESYSGDQASSRDYVKNVQALQREGFTRSLTNGETFESAADPY